MKFLSSFVIQIIFLFCKKILLCSKNILYDSLHVIDDFHLQGILGSMKQKEWWKKQEGYKDLYKDDYITALMIHSISWSIFISIPLWFFPIQPYLISIAIIINTIIHYYVDDLKCNKLKISLSTDQCIHFLQIFFNWLILGFLQ